MGEVGAEVRLRVGGGRSGVLCSRWMEPGGASGGGKTRRGGRSRGAGRAGGRPLIMVMFKLSRLISTRVGPVRAAGEEVGVTSLRVGGVEAERVQWVGGVVAGQWRWL